MTKTATKYIITGRTESVRSAAAQFEKILGLEPGSSAIIDTTYKTTKVILKITCSIESQVIDIGTCLNCQIRIGVSDKSTCIVTSNI